MNDDLKRKAEILRSALMALPGYGEKTYLENTEFWIEPGSMMNYEFVLLERPEFCPFAYFRIDESRTLSVDMARAVATILNELPQFLTALGDSGDTLDPVPDEEP